MTLPSLIAIGRAVATIPICALLALASADTDLAALGIFAIAGLSDVLDGRFARARGEVTALGARLDPLADKVLVAGVLTALAVRGLAQPWAVGLILTREAFAVALRARTARPLPAAPDGRAKTLLQMSAAAALIASGALGSATLLFVANGLLFAAVALTMVSGVHLARRAAYA